MDETKAVFYGGLTVVLFIAALLGHLYGTVAVLLGFIGAFGFLMMCVGLDVTVERMKEGR